MNDWFAGTRWLTKLGALALALGGSTAAFLTAPNAEAQAEPNACLSTDPNHWPAPSKPYFMIAFDTSGSMTSNSVAGAGSTCNFSVFGGNSTRLAHGKCAIQNTVKAFAGEANFGLASYARTVNCNDNCGNCVFDEFDNSAPADNCGSDNGCGPEPASGAGCIGAPDDLQSGCRRGGNILVPLWQDNHWAATPNPSNVAEILQWVDNSCVNDRELFGSGCTPMNGMLRDMYRYLRFGWTRPPGATPVQTFNTPLESLATGERACRRVNVILVTDGEETCDQASDGADAAAHLYQGWTAGGITWNVRTSVINFGGDGADDANRIADAGDNGVVTCSDTGCTNGSARAFLANNEAELSQALATIITAGIQPEVCDNVDNNCNGCSDEGYRKFCNRGKTPVADPTATGQCCTWTDLTQRAACLTRYNASITTGNPTGNLYELPCWNPAAADSYQNHQKWLCTDPAEVCDNADNNCNAICTGTPVSAGGTGVVCGFQNLNSPPNAIDETFNKCGTPLACPTAEVCDGRDNNCDNIIDNAAGSGVPFSLPNCSQCVPTTEICDGCDNDCDGTADNGTFTQTCGFTPPANCAGNQSCLAPASVPRGTCLPGFPRPRFGTCSNTPQPEICDGIDNNCNGSVDEGLPPVVCNIPNTPPPNIVYGPTPFAQSQCRRGTMPCGGTCTGWVGPSDEICDGIDNDCNGVVDDNVPGVGNPCGSAAGQCRKGTTACVGGQLVCQGGQQPQPEVCNGLDDDCDGTPDDAPLGDAPANSACWNRPPTGCTPVCSHQNAQWCPPAGATCNTRGTLSTPCATGNLVCDGANRWKCVGGQEPGIEVCDGIDNNCNSQIDEGTIGPPVGQPCGPDDGECEPGRNVCTGGRIVCTGGIGPTDEICDGKDNDCDRVIDDGIDVGGPCQRPYDTNLYPGDRTKGECKPGTLVCNQGCVGGTGPVPEVCDGKDNDCDGAIDESGPQPDGIDGTADPNDPSRVLGGACGVSVGECRQGRWGCVMGRVLCTGTVGPQPEECDCKDNDCNGQVDDEVDGGSPLCGGGRRCAQVAAGVCQCAGPCLGGEFPCPQGLSCRDVPISGSMTTAQLCVNDPCGNCATKTVNNPTSMMPECGPGGTLPLCVCKGTAGCRAPCFNVMCGDEQRCATQGPAAGTCQPDTNCNFFGCPAGNACHSGSCVPNPCSPNPCATGEVCKPNADFTGHRCEGTCANVTCPAGEECKGGVCTPNGCGQACAAGQYCFPPPAMTDAGRSDAGADAGAEASTDAGVGTCGPSRCATESGLPCSDGRYCNPITGGCEDDPCSGVVCPAAQSCRNGECDWTPETGGTGGTGGTTGSGGRDAGSDSSAGAGGGSAAGGAGGGSAAGGGGPEKPKGSWGLATGGGGCACRVGGEPNRLASTGALLMALGVVVTAFRRKRRRPKREAGLAGGAQ